MEYIQISYNLESCEEFIIELLPSFLAEIGFDSFEEITGGLNAYCPKDLFSETEMISVIHSLPCSCDKISYTIEEVANINWNAKWEEDSFRPIEINDRCCVRPSTHVTERDYEFDIVVNPTQSFGTGYHETTRMMMNSLFNVGMQNKFVLDMGCGTAVLSILAEKLGASNVTAIDIDKWSADNAIENSNINQCNNINVLLGDAKLLSSIEQKFDIVLANINRNILTSDMASYQAKMNTGSLLIMSGFLENDYSIIANCAAQLGMKAKSKVSENGWVCCSFCK